MCFESLRKIEAFEGLFCSLDFTFAATASGENGCVVLQRFLAFYFPFTEAHHGWDEAFAAGLAFKRDGRQKGKPSDKP